MSKTALDFANYVLSSFPANRCADLAARAAAGHLTSLELLALGILRGGAIAEESVPGFIDAALAEYNHGGYRVPVRVVADWSRCLFVATVPPQTNEIQLSEFHGTLLNGVRRLVSGGYQVLTVMPGCKIEVFECAVSSANPVIVKKEPTE